MENLELIIFDLDGTLVDSEVVYRRGWSKVLKRKGRWATLFLISWFVVGCKLVI